MVYALVRFSLSESGAAGIYCPWREKKMEKLAFSDRHYLYLILDVAC